MQIAGLFLSRTNQTKRADFSHTDESKAIEEVSGAPGQTWRDFPQEPHANFAQIAMLEATDLG
jgi:hypothetical protein